MLPTPMRSIPLLIEANINFNKVDVVYKPKNITRLENALKQDDSTSAICSVKKKRTKATR